MEQNKTDILQSDMKQEDPKHKDNKKDLWGEMIVFALVWGILLAVLSYVCNPVLWRNRPTFVQERDAYVAAALTQPERSIDVAVLGDSEAMVLLWPKLFEEKTGKSVFIVGQSGQNAAEAYYTLKALHKQSPECVLLETDLLVAQNNERRELINSFNASVEDFYPVFRYHGMWKESMGIKEPAVIKHDRGFGKRLAVEPYTGGEYMTPSQEKSKILFITSLYFDKIMKLCKERKIRLVLVSGIVPSAFNYEKHNALQALADEKGLTYIDLNETSVREEIGIDFETDFLDGGDHVNASGSIKVTEYLSKKLDL